MDTFVAALKVGATGWVLGIDMTQAQLAKADRLRVHHDFRNVGFLDG
jgi:arsenite methyltransferase